MIWILLGIMVVSLATVAIIYWLAPELDEHHHDPANYR